MYLKREIVPRSIIAISIWQVQLTQMQSDSKNPSFLYQTWDQNVSDMALTHRQANIITSFGVQELMATAD